MNITMTKSEYTRTSSGKSWKSNPDTVSTEDVTLEQVNRIVSDETVSFFRNLGGWERVERAYTPEGYLPVKSISIAPDRSQKNIREFDYNL